MITFYLAMGMGFATLGGGYIYRWLEGETPVWLGLVSLIFASICLYMHQYLIEKRITEAAEARNSEVQEYMQKIYGREIKELQDALSKKEN
jgi:hypothetical protein